MKSKITGEKLTSKRAQDAENLLLISYRRNLTEKAQKQCSDHLALYNNYEENIGG